MNAARRQSAGETATCPWCSATVPAEASRCPSCDAALRDAVDGDVLGVTQVDVAAASRLARLKPPGRIAVLLGAEPTSDGPEVAGRIEPPSEEVRKEMLRLELAAIDAEIEAKNAQLEAERVLGADGAPTTADTTTAAPGPMVESSPEPAPDVAPEESSTTEPG